MTFHTKSCLASNFQKCFREKPPKTARFPKYHQAIFNFFHTCYGKSREHAISKTLLKIKIEKLIQKKKKNSFSEMIPNSPRFHKREREQGPNLTTELLIIIHRIGKKNCQQHVSNSVTTIFIYGYTNLVKKEYTRNNSF